MKRNIGDIDALLRTMLAFVLAYIYFISKEPNTLKIIAVIWAGFLMLTAVHGASPFYRVFKISTRNKKYDE